MSTSKTFAVDYFFLFNERTVTQKKYYRACTNKSCKNSKGQEIWAGDMNSKNPEKFCELCGHSMHKYEKETSLTTNDASDLLHYLYQQETDQKVIEKMQDFIWTPEYRDPRFACYNYTIRNKKPDFDNDSFLVLDGSFTAPAINSENQKRIDFILDYINSRLGENTVELHFGAYTYTH